MIFEDVYATVETPGLNGSQSSFQQEFVGRKPTYSFNVDAASKNGVWLFEVPVPRWLQFENDYITELEITVSIGGEGLDISSLSHESAPMLSLTDKRDTSFTFRPAIPSPRIFPGTSFGPSTITPASTSLDPYYWEWSVCEDEFQESEAWGTYSNVKELKMVVKNDPILTNSITIDGYSLSDPSKRINRCEYPKDSGTFDTSRQLYLQFGHYWNISSQYSVESISFEKRYTNTSSLSYFRRWNNGNWKVERLYSNCSDDCYSLSEEDGSFLIKASVLDEDDIYALGITLPMEEGGYFDVDKDESMLSVTMEIARMSESDQPWLWSFSDSKGKTLGIKFSLSLNLRKLSVSSFSNAQAVKESSGVPMTSHTFSQTVSTLTLTVNLMNFERDNTSSLELMISDGPSSQLSDVLGSFATHDPITMKLLSYIQYLSLLSVF